MSLTISTPESYAIPLSGILARQASLTNLDAQMATGTRLLSPGTDPAAAAESIQVANQTSALSLDTQTAGMANDNLGQISGTIGSVINLLQSIRQSALAAVNGTVNSQDRQAIADTVNNGSKELLQLANTQTPGGSYLFSGSQSGTQPFALQSNGTVSYYGDASANHLQISPNLTVPASLSGQFLFMDIPTGNGAAQVTAASGNAGAATVTVGGIVDPLAAAAMDASNSSYTLSFSVSGGALLYSVVASGTTSVVASGTYEAGATIAVGGSEFTMHGTPAANDAFTISPSKNQSLFSTLQQVVSLLSNVGVGGAAQAQFAQGMDNVIASLNQGLTRALTAQAGVGANMAEIQAVSTANTNLRYADAQTQSDVSSANIAQVASAFAEGQTALQAALSAFSAMNGLNLFSVLKF